MFYLFVESIKSPPLAQSIIETLKPLFFNEECGDFCLLTLFIISLFICEENGVDIAEVFTLKKADVDLLVGETIGSVSFTMLQKLRFVNKMCISTKNRELLTDENLMQMVCSVYADEKSTTEQELASAILTCLYTDAQEDATFIEEDDTDPEDILSLLLNDIAVHVEDSLQNCSDEERGLRICVSLQHLLTNLSSIEGLQCISNYPRAVNVFCIYLKLHIQHLGKL